MSKRILIVLGIELLAACSGGRPQVDRIFENGIEVVLNHVQPYRIAGEPSRVDLEREFVIDAENPELLSGRIHVLHEKDNGFKEILAYKAVWH